MKSDRTTGKGGIGGGFRDVAAPPELWERAGRVVPGGVNSPVRSFRSVGSTPFFVERGEGAWLVDTRGNRYVDYVLSWGPLILGHAPEVVSEALRGQLGRGTSFGAPTEAEVELAERIVRLVPSVEKVRLVNSGTEATMTALRVARAATERDGFLKFSGCYHGHADPFLVSAGSGVATLGLPNSPGVPEAATGHTFVAPFNDLDAVETAFERHEGAIGAVILEPVIGNAGLIEPVEGFLEGLRTLTRRHGAILIFDEVMTGFRVGLGGAQERYGVSPDLTTLGKVVGGGLPVGAVGGRADLMDRLAPVGPVYQAGTLSGNPLATAAGNAQLRWLEENDPFPLLEERARLVMRGVTSALADHGIPSSGAVAGSMFGIFFREGPVRSFEEARVADTDAFGRFHCEALRRGVFFAPSPFEAGFVSTAHGEAEIEHTLRAAHDAVRAMAETDEQGERA